MESNGLGSLVDFFGFTSMPDLDIWEFPLLMIGGTLSSIETTPLEIIKQELETASKLINENIEQLDKYTDRIDESGARVITILEFVSSLGQAAASRHPIGRFIYPFIQSAAERGSKVTHGVSQEFGWIDWLKEGAIDVVLEYGIDKITKPLKPILEKHLALYLDNLSPKELKEMGLTNDIFVSKGRKLIIAFLDNLGQSTLEGTVKQAIEALNGKRDLTIMEFASIVVNDALAATFIEWIKLSHSK
jgi:hypothetical protein